MTGLSLVLLGALALSACGESLSALPTAPSSASASVDVSKLTVVTAESLARTFEVSGVTVSWNQAEGCIFQKPALAPEVFGSVPPSTRMAGTGELWGLWPDPAQPKPEVTCHKLGTSMSELVTVQRYIVATFVKQDEAWRYCQWSPAVSEMIALRTIPCE